MKNNKIALICIDFINDIVTKWWKVTWKWYLDFVTKNNTLNNVKLLQDKFRIKDLDIFHVKISFPKDYNNHPTTSPLFWKAKEFEIFKEWTWWTEFSDLVKPLNLEEIILKTRISSFYKTNLEEILRKKWINTIYISGVSTDLAVESTVRDAHDRDFNVIVVSDCCAWTNYEDHINSLKILEKISIIKNLDEIIL